MTTFEALRIFGIKKEEQASDMPRIYKNLQKQFHPDINPQGEEMSKLINSAWDHLKPEWEMNQNFGMDHMKWSWWGAETNAESAYLEKVQEALKFAQTLDGVVTELIGSWVWLSGETRKQKDKIKSFQDNDNNKFCWHRTKKVWFYRPVNFKSKGRGSNTFDEMREKYGSTIFTATEGKKIN